MEKIIAVIIDYETSPYMNQPIDSKGRNSFDIVLDKVSKLDIPYYVFTCVQKNGMIPFQKDTFSLLNTIQEKIPPFEHLLFFHSEMPLVDLDMTQKIIHSHLENIADYTFGEHYPEGFSPFMIQYGTFKKLQMMTQGNNEIYHYKSIDKLIQLDINSYDVEIILSPTDLRFIRDSFRVSNKRSYELIKQFSQHYPGNKDLFDFFKTHSSLLRPIPSFVQIEISSDCNQKCIHCPHTHRKNEKKNLSAHQFNQLINQLSEFMENGTIELSGYGEPFLNPEINIILDSIKNYPHFDFILETNGTLIGDYIDQIGIIPNLNLIISLDAPNPDLYQRIRGEAHFEKVEENIEKFFHRYPKKGYLQLTRMDLNEDQLDEYLQRWRVIRDRILIQKHNDFCSKLKNHKVVDLAPLIRFACWKLQRELYIHADGLVSLCSQDFEKKQGIGNVFQDTISKIWNQSQENYESHWQEKYPKFCENCDEWYIFSF